MTNTPIIPAQSHPKAPLPVWQLRNGGVSVILAQSDTQNGAGSGAGADAGTSVSVNAAADTTATPGILAWGADPGPLSVDQLSDLARASRRQLVTGTIDQPLEVSVLPVEADGWPGTPGVAGGRPSQEFSPRFTTRRLTATDTKLTLELASDDDGLLVTLTLDIDKHGVLHQSLQVHNTGATRFRLDALAHTLPLPPEAAEILTTTGRHLRERHPQREPLTIGVHARESRRGRPGADATVITAVGSPGFGFEHGRVWAAHLAWSGNHRVSVERQPSGIAVLQAGELLLPGEVILEPGETYAAPELLATCGDGLNEVSARFHSYFRARPEHPHSERPVTLNTWEAVYFRQELGQLTALADAAATIGVERLVLDDGWFLGRRDDTAGLGDWYVDPEVWPDGLDPLIRHVHDLGMQFGLWVEPEMVNPVSRLAVEHPEWILHTGSTLPPAARNQQVVDLSNPDAFAYILERLDALLSENAIDYLKWDHNRDLLQPGGADGRAAVHENVLALYRLLAELKARHPGIEIESCASGGARVDAGILHLTDRIWTSDCIDPLERLPIQKYTGVLVPPELMGAHIGSPVAHSTGRASSLALRAATALFGHLGIEWDITEASDAERAELAAWVRLHKRMRTLAHSGRFVHADLGDPAMDLRGVISSAQDEAWFVYTQVGSTASYPPGAIHFPGLDPERAYTLTRLHEPRMEPDYGLSPLEWAAAGEGVTLPGSVLGSIGVQAPVLLPDQVAIFHLRA